jgi:hypothetical protein
VGVLLTKRTRSPPARQCHTDSVDVVFVFVIRQRQVNVMWNFKTFDWLVLKALLVCLALHPVDFGVEIS